MRNEFAQKTFLLTSDKMPSEVKSCTTEKSHHYTYLKEFRTEQCQLFLQHKCTQHRPFTCFNWHFLNQRRRRPIKKKDGKFSYSPDNYCTQYDETTGVCQSGEDCQYLHRTAGDTERRYHLRYYKTSPCVHETDQKGYCVKNGPHCAFAHGDNDLRQPVYDDSDMCTDFNDRSSTSNEAGIASTQLEKDRAANEDAKWNDTGYVLDSYKTEQCKRPPRLCRQGYACPSYHNAKDRRRPPRKFKYRSTPCPDVKHGDDWGDPAQCDNGEDCSYCHTRTEQQFHPEIYKSSKCNDAMQTGFCPRGSFCAFAHVDTEMNSTRELSSSAGNTLAAFIPGMLSNDANKSTNGTHSSANNEQAKQNGKKSASVSSEGAIDNGADKDVGFMPRMPRLGSFGTADPISRQRTRTASGSMGIVSDSSLLHRAPGSERESLEMKNMGYKFKQDVMKIDNDPTLKMHEKVQMKQNLLHTYNPATLPGGMAPGLTASLTSNNNGTNMCALPGLQGSLLSSVGQNAGQSTSNTQGIRSSAMSPHAQSFYPPADTVESVIGNAFEDDLGLTELNLGIDIMPHDSNNDDNNSVCSSLGSGFHQPSSSYYGTSSVPVTIPQGGMQRNSLSHMSQSPSTPPHSLGSSFFDTAPIGFHNPSSGNFSNSFFGQDVLSVSPHGGSMSPSTIVGGGQMYNGIGTGDRENARLRDELKNAKTQLGRWNDCVKQARVACEAWNKESEELKMKVKQLEDEKSIAFQQRDDMRTQLLQFNSERAHQGGGFLHCLDKVNELRGLPQSHLKQLQTQLTIDLQTLNQVMNHSVINKCELCHDKTRPLTKMSCGVHVCCESCFRKNAQCVQCNQSRLPNLMGGPAM